MTHDVQQILALAGFAAIVTVLLVWNLRTGRVGSDDSFNDVTRNDMPFNFWFEVVCLAFVDAALLLMLLLKVWALIKSAQ
jgi:hypothetical protein